MSSEHPALTEWMYIRLSLHLYSMFNIEIVLSCLLGATDTVKCQPKLRMNS